jgi:hypothetical protein
MLKFVVTIFPILDDNKVEKVEELATGSKEQSENGENQFDDEDEPLVIFCNS